MSYRRQQAIIEDLNYFNDPRVRAARRHTLYTVEDAGPNQARVTMTDNLVEAFVEGYDYEEPHPCAMCPNEQRWAVGWLLLNGEPRTWGSHKFDDRGERCRGVGCHRDAEWEDRFEKAARAALPPTTFMVSTRFKVCPTCRGSGKVVDPSIDCCGITREDFDEDPDFRASYMRGDYDQVCPECRGDRVVPGFQLPEPWASMVEEYRRQEEADWAERAAEIRMGC